MGLDIRKVITVVDETRTEGGRSDDGPPLRKAACAVVIRNPYAFRDWTEELDELTGPSAELGELIGTTVVAALNAPVESHGKAVLVGTAGEQEHGNAVKTTTFGNPFRAAFDGSAWLPSTTKRCAPGAPVDVPLCFKDEIWVRSHYDTITVAVPDAPAPDEIVLIGAVASRGRINARLGGKTLEQALAEQATGA